MSTLEVKELSHPAGEVIKIAAGKTLDLHSQGNVKMPAGSVIQVVNVYSNTPTSSSSSWITAVTGSITMSSASNKLLAIGVGRGEIETTATYIHAGTRLVSSGSGVSGETINVYQGSDNNPFGLTLGYTTSNQRLGFSNPINHVFSPNIAGNVTVSFQGKGYNSFNTIHFNRYSPSESHLLLMEIAQ